MTEQHEPAVHAAEPGDTGRRRTTTDPIRTVRSGDLEPYTGLRYLSTLFRVMAILLVLLLVAEGVAGAIAVGRASVPTLLAEAGRLLVLAGILWGAGDLAVLLVDIGHDVRATRILLVRQTAHQLGEHEVQSGASADRPARLDRVQADAPHRHEGPADIG